MILFDTREVRRDQEGRYDGDGATNNLTLHLVNFASYAMLQIT